MAKSPYQKDKVYLKDRRRGTIYPYDRHLARNRNFVAVVPNASKQEAKQESKQEDKQESKQEDNKEDSGKGQGTSDKK